MLRDEEARLKALEKPDTPESSETSVDEDYLERRKIQFNIRENLERRKNKWSLLETSRDDKIVSILIYNIHDIA